MPGSLQHPTRLVIGLLLVVAIFVLDLSVPRGIAGGVPYIAVVLLALWLPSRLTVLVAAVCSVLTIVGGALSPPGGEPLFVLANRVLALFAIWTVAIIGSRWRQLRDRHEQVLEERERALDEIKILHGVIPICSSCKQIRNERGAWSELETYIEERSEADFTHGICPDCASELYGRSAASSSASATARSSS